MTRQMTWWGLTLAAPLVFLLGLPGARSIAQEGPAAGTQTARLLCDFEGEAEVAKWGVKDAAVTRSDAHPTQGKTALQVTVAAGATGVLAWWERQDWSGYQQLLLDVFNAQDEPVSLTIQVWDVPGEGAYAKRYQGSFTANEGPNTITLELSELRTNDRSRVIDASQVQQLLIMAKGLTSPTVLYLDNLRLAGAYRGTAPKLLHAWSRYPGLFFYYREPEPHAIEMTVTNTSVTPPAALRLGFPQREGAPGWVFKELGRNEGTDFSAYEGFSFWSKGDGSAARGAVRLSYSEGGPTATFPLAETAWHRVDLRWSDFDQAVQPTKIEVLAFGLAAGSPRPASYLIDRPQFVPGFAELGAESELAAQANAAPPRPDPELADPAALVARGETLVKARQLLAEKKPLTILAWGDSVTGGAQLWTVGDEAAQARAVYHGQLRRHLVERFGYDDINIIKVSHGGYQVRQAVPNLQAEVLDKKPDLVILAFGAGDTLYSDIDTYRRLYPDLIERIRAAGIEVILFVPTPVEFRVAEGEPFAGFVREYAAEHDIATADVRAGLMSQGEAFLARWISDGAHPNQRAHEYMGAILAELFR